MTHVLGQLKDHTLYLKEALTLNECSACSSKKESTPFNHEALYIDAQHLKHLDSVGLAYLIKHVRTLRQSGIRIHWLNIPECLRKLTQLYEIETWLLT